MPDAAKPKKGSKQDATPASTGDAPQDAGTTGDTPADAAASPAGETAQDTGTTGDTPADAAASPATGGAPQATGAQESSPVDESTSTGPTQVTLTQEQIERLRSRLKERYH